MWSEVSLSKNGGFHYGTMEKQCLPGLCHLGDGKPHFKLEDIKCVVDELHWVFDMKTIDEAEEHYQNSPY